MGAFQNMIKSMVVIAGLVGVQAPGMTSWAQNSCNELKQSMENCVNEICAADADPSWCWETYYGLRLTIEELDWMSRCAALTEEQFQTIGQSRCLDLINAQYWQVEETHRRLAFVHTAIDGFQETQNRLPETLDELVTLGFCLEIPPDPWNQPLSYNSDTGFMLFSMGPDGAEGTLDDVSNRVTEGQLPYQMGCPYPAGCQLRRVEDGP